MKLEVVCLSDENYAYGVINYEGNDYIDLEPIALGINEQVELKAIITKEQMSSIQYEVK